ncbi:uncharacterized protein LOC118202140 [Stegodyphus dumicola]|uniref:uncharacterized protein LOC118202140 n=1 Tax=Stegodyphus dumicola TaxID=202533 RepID=UPI0015AE1F40|nr:uncharacterized protein LOC118202140 [Stegodyphus dumicola]
MAYYNRFQLPNTLLRYPKIKLPTFDGSVRNWLYFWGQFQKIDEDINIDFHDKSSYLSQVIEKGSPAEELIKIYPPGGNSYEKALKQLKMRFGREELLIQVYFRDLLVLVLQKQNTSKNSLRKLFDQLESKLRSLELLGVTREKYAAMLFPLVESSLPEETLVAWQRYRSAHRRIREVNLDDSDESKTIIEKSDLECILEILQAEFEAEERIFFSLSKFQHIETKSRSKT